MPAIICHPAVSPAGRPGDHEKQIPSRQPVSVCNAYTAVREAQSKELLLAQTRLSSEHALVDSLHLCRGCACVRRRNGVASAGVDSKTLPAQSSE
jgi:hypothetical protein